MNLLIAIVVPVLVSVVVVGAAKVWQREIERFLRWMERY